MEQNRVSHFYYFNWHFDILKSKSWCIFLNKNLNLHKIEMERNRKWKMPHTVFERRTSCFSSYKNRKLKVNLWQVGVRERKKRVFFVPFILSEDNFFKDLCFMSVYSVMNTLSEYTYISKKHYFIHFCCLFLKSSKAFIVPFSSFSGT